MGYILTTILSFFSMCLLSQQQQMYYTPPVDVYSGTYLYCNAEVMDSATVSVSWADNYTGVSYIVQKNTGSGWLSLDTVQASPYSDTVTERAWNTYRIKATNAGKVVKTSNERTIPAWWAYALEGADGDSLTASGISKLDITGAFSLEAIVEIDSFISGVDTTRLVTIDGTGGRLTWGFADAINRYLGFYYSSDSLIAVTSQNEIGGTPEQYSGSFTEKKLLHLVATYDGAGDVDFYVDGDLIAKTNDSTPTTADITGNYDVTIGGGGNAVFYGIRFYNAQLSGAQIDSLWNNGSIHTEGAVGTPIINLTFQDDTLSGTTYTVVDAAASPANFSSAGTEGNERALQSNFRNSYGMDAVAISPGIYTSVDVRTGPYEDDTAGNGPFGPTSLIQPKVWWMGGGKTLVAFTDKAGHGGNKRAAYLMVNHGADVVTRHWYGNIISDGIVDTHPQVAAVTYNGSIVTVQEDQHNSPIYVRTTSESYPSDLILSSTVNQDGSAYPSLTICNDTLFSLWRDSGTSSNSADRVYYSTDGENFSEIGNKFVELGDGWAYPHSWPHPEKIIFCAGYAPGGPPIEQLYYIESTDGETWANARGTFQKNIASSGPLSLAELQDSCLLHTDITSAGLWGAAITPDNTTYLITADDSLSAYRVYWFDAASNDWSFRRVDFELSNEKADVCVIPIDNDSFYWFEIETRGGFDVIVRYRTDDTFQTFDSGTVISPENKNYSQPTATANSYAADIITLVANEEVADDRANIFIYTMRK